MDITLGTAGLRNILQASDFCHTNLDISYKEASRDMNKQSICSMGQIHPRFAHCYQFVFFQKNWGGPRFFLFISIVEKGRREMIC